MYTRFLRFFLSALSLSALSVVLLGVPFFAAASEVAPDYYGGRRTKTTAEFNDVLESHPFATTIIDLKAKGFVNGYGDGTFKPDNSVSRAEFITMLAASLRMNLSAGNCFKDVKAGDWYSRFVCTAKAKGWVNGYADGTFKPDKNINVAEAGAIMAKAYRLMPRQPKSSEPWYKPALEKMERKGVLPTSIDFVEKKLSRSETGEMIYRLSQKITNKPAKTYAALTASLPTISSCSELEEKFKFAQYRQDKRNLAYSKAIPMMMMESTRADESGDDTAAAPAQPGPGSGAGERDYSQTNVQVEGVDEGDIVKNDDTYIYFLSRKNIRVVKAFPATEMQEVAKLEFADKQFSPTDLFITKDKLMIIGMTWARASMRGGGGKSTTTLYVYAMSPERQLTEERVLQFDGYPLSSRKIGNRVYLVMRDSPQIYRIFNMENPVPLQQELPHFLDSKTGSEKPMVECSGIKFLPHYENPDFVAVASIDVSNPQSEVGREVIMGAGNTVYASTSNLYIAGTRWEYPELQKFDVFAPWHEGKETTTIFRFRLEQDGSVKFHGKGDVPGHLLNQFSLDEEGSAFRVATTTGEVWNSGDGRSKNHIYILDKENLEKTLGKIENIAPGEKIYSVRFLGKRAYMVTFKKIDPFFVIDLSDNSAPKILGELKIPGYSDYLHPFDENHIIGFGKEAVDPASVEDEWPGRDFDFAWYQGMKIALFDVTDVANPKVLFKEVVGDRGTESELLHNHRALLFDKARGLFAFPVTVAEIADKTAGQYTGSQSGTPVFKGAYVYTLDLTNGFQLKGKVTHYDEGLPKNCTGQPEREYCWVKNDDRKDIQRIIYIGDHLYTISAGVVKAVKREEMTVTQTLDFKLESQNYGDIID